MEYIYRNIENIPVDIEYPDDFENTVTNTLCKPIIYNRFKKIAHCPKFGETFDYVDTIRKGDFLPFRGEGRTFMPHTCHPVLCGQTYVWMFYREETIYFVAAYASWMYGGEEETPGGNRSRCISNWIPGRNKADESTYRRGGTRR